MRAYYSCFLFVLSSLTVYSQQGGRHAYDFLNVANTARLGALGGVNVSLHDQDLNFFMSNPALAGDTLAGWASANYLFYIADIGQASFAYAHRFKKIGVLNFGIQHMNYGDIMGYDDTGIELGTFRSSETAWVIGKNYQQGNFRFGSNLKFVFSNIAGFRSQALMIDLGGIFTHPDNRFTAGVVIRNVGFRISDYSSTANSKLPLDVRFGTTFKPEHMPIRFSLTAYNLVRPGEAFDDPADDEDVSSVNKILRHVTLGAELLFHKNVNVLLGYNFARKQELQIPAGGGGAGFSFGLAANIKTVQVVLSRTGYTAGNAGYAFTISSSLNSLFFKSTL